MIETMESAICTRCMQPIAQELILVEERVEGFRKRQTVKAYCNHCNILHEMERERADGFWQRVGQVIITEGGSHLKKFKLALQDRLGVLRKEQIDRGTKAVACAGNVNGFSLEADAAVPEPELVI